MSPASLLISPRDRLGTHVGGRWRLDALVAVGGSSAIYVATHANGHRVAMKVFDADQASSPTAIAHFLREGRVANRVGHPGVVAVVDEGTTDDGAPFLLMPLLDGETAQQRLARSPAGLPASEALAIVEAVLDVLVRPPTRGASCTAILKPDNVCPLEQGGGIRVLDFWHRVFDAASPDTTAHGTVLGTPGYMAPEQARGKLDEVGPRSATSLVRGRAPLFLLHRPRLARRCPTPARLRSCARRARPCHPARQLVPGHACLGGRGARRRAGVRRVPPLDGRHDDALGRSRRARPGLGRARSALRARDAFRAVVPRARRRAARRSRADLATAPGPPRPVATRPLGLRRDARKLTIGFVVAAPLPARDHGAFTTLPSLSHAPAAHACGRGPAPPRARTHPRPRSCARAHGFSRACAGAPSLRCRRRPPRRPRAAVSAARRPVTPRSRRPRSSSRTSMRSNARACPRSRPPRVEPARHRSPEDVERSSARPCQLAGRLVRVLRLRRAANPATPDSASGLSLRAQRAAVTGPSRRTSPRSATATSASRAPAPAPARRSSRGRTNAAPAHTSAPRRARPRVDPRATCALQRPPVVHSCAASPGSGRAPAAPRSRLRVTCTASGDASAAIHRRPRAVATRAVVPDPGEAVEHEVARARRGAHHAGHQALVLLRGIADLLAEENDMIWILSRRSSSDAFHTSSSG